MNTYQPQIPCTEMIDGQATALVAVNADLRVDQMNPAAEIMFGVGGGLARGAPVFQVLPNLLPLEGPIRSALAEHQPFSARDIRLDRPNNGGDSLVADVLLTPMRERAALLLEFNTRDRQHRISRDDAQWQQQEVSHEMIRGLAHEIKNPLGGLRGAAQLLERELPSEELREFTSVIIREADRLQELVDRLLGPNRPVPMVPLNIHVVLEHVRTLLEAQAPAGVEIDRDYDPSLPELAADEEQLIQAVLNIGVNALEAMGDSGRLLLRSRAMRKFTIGGSRHRLVLRLDIVDTGPGVTSDMREKIFYPMVSTRPDGSGLGLAIAQTLVRNHGGLIECDSRPGETVFSLYLPVRTVA